MNFFCKNGIEKTIPKTASQESKARDRGGGDHNTRRQDTQRTSPKVD
jgi:hypothetical protein